MFNILAVILFVSHSFLSEKSIVVVKSEKYKSFNEEMLKKTNKTAEDLNFFDVNEMKGCIGEFNTASLEYLNSHSDVKYVETVKNVLPFAVQKTPRNWGLTRISHKTLADSFKDNIYKFKETGGKDVIVYVIDSGVSQNKAEFGDRVKIEKNYVDNINDDGLGHGSHVCGIIGSKSYGVAKNVHIRVMKVFDSEGKGASSEILIRALSDSINQIKTNKLTSIINLSLGLPRSRAINDMIKQAHQNEIMVVSAAGNEHKDACSYSPASSAYSITVGNIDKNDMLAPSSNFGKCVNINAPGTDIYSTYKGGQTKSLSGTSMAAPFVTGVLALHLSDHSYKDLKEAYHGLISSSNNSTNIGSVPNTRRILFDHDATKETQ